jgi:hypothetical protein
MICWPSAFVSSRLTSRALVSVVPPGANGTIMRSGFTGYAGSP